MCLHKKPRRDQVNPATLAHTTIQWWGLLFCPCVFVFLCFNDVMITILQKNDHILRGKAEKVPVSDIDSKKIKGVVSDMKKAMAGEKDAVAIAAPQIGVPFRIFAVSGKVFEKDAEIESAADVKEDEKKKHDDMVFINPEITRRSRKKVTMDEGCLSVRWWYGGVERAEKATIKAYDENGKIFTRGASGLLAQIFQHETDHLDGVLFTDKAQNLREEPPKNE